jgi:hypothetical protein
MLIKIAHPHPIKPSEITTETVYANRRRFLLQMGLATLHWELPCQRRSGAQDRMSAMAYNICPTNTRPKVAIEQDNWIARRTGTRVKLHPQVSVATKNIQRRRGGVI